MTRRYWAGVMFFSLIVTLGAAYFTWISLKEKAVVEVPLTAVAQSTTSISQTEAMDVNTSSDTLPRPSSSAQNNPAAEPVQQNSSPQMPEPAPGTRNILFSYRKASAKEVFLIGSFNNWMRTPMKKNSQGVWETAIQLKPGFYEYRYVVDGRKIKDPNTKLYTPSGNSILKVKPLADN